MKRCSKCGKEKSLEYFSRHVRYKDGFRTQCKECEKKYKKPRSQWKDSTKIAVREWEKKQRDSLSDWWVKKCILIKSRGKIKTKQITFAMIAKEREKRLQWKEKRVEREAYKKAYPQVPKELTRVCIICGKTYDVKGKSLFCSDECRNKDQMSKYYANRDSILRKVREKWWQGKKPPKEFECKECRKIVVYKYEPGGNRGRGRFQFCSDKCSNKYNKRIYGTNHNHRARHFGCEHKAVNPLRVFMRDGWKCQLCGLKLRAKDKGTLKDKAPELDHIIPLSKGGPHSYQNTQCVCRKCNSDKGNRKIGQLRLFG